MQSALIVEIRMAWWFKFYVFGVTFMCLLTNGEPDEQKSLYWSRKAVRAKINGKRMKLNP